MLTAELLKIAKQNKAQFKKYVVDEMAKERNITVLRLHRSTRVRKQKLKYTFPKVFGALNPNLASESRQIFEIS